MCICPLSSLNALYYSYSDWTCEDWESRVKQNMEVRIWKSNNWNSKAWIISLAILKMVLWHNIEIRFWKEKSAQLNFFFLKSLGLLCSSGTVPVSRLPNICLSWLLCWGWSSTNRASYHHDVVFISYMQNINL